MASSSGRHSRTDSTESPSLIRNFSKRFFESETDYSILDLKYLRFLARSKLIQSKLAWSKLAWSKLARSVIALALDLPQVRLQKRGTIIKPYFYGFSKTLKVYFPRDQLWSRGKETLFQYRKGIAYINRLLTGTETKFLFLEIKVGPEEKKLLRFLKNRKNTVLNHF